MSGGSGTEKVGKGVWETTLLRRVCREKRGVGEASPLSDIVILDVFPRPSGLVAANSRQNRAGFCRKGLLGAIEEANRSSGSRVSDYFGVPAAADYWHVNHADDFFELGGLW